MTNIDVGCVVFMYGYWIILMYNVWWLYTNID